MSLDYATLDLLRYNHPAWRLLCSDHAPLIASFLQRVFIASNTRVIAQADLAEALDDELFGLRERLGAQAFPKSAIDYLTDWAAHDKGWLRKFYTVGSDEPQFDLMPATEKAIAWLATLTERSFVGTESRLLTMFDLLKQMSEGSDADPQTRLGELHLRRDRLDAEIAQVLAGNIPLLNDTALKERFQQFMALARELLGDFREVEHNFRTLDRHVRERITLWKGVKGELLEEILNERETIANSDQGRSFRAFWDFLMSSTRQEELSGLLERVLALPPVIDLKPDTRIRRVHYDWLEAGEHTQRTVAQLSQQLRRFLDDQAWLENRRIMDILHSIESRALAMRASPPTGDIMEMPGMTADIELPMERPLHVPAFKPRISSMVLDSGDSLEDVDATALFSQVVIDKAQLAGHIRRSLQERLQVTLQELTQSQPLQQGLAELVAYLQLADDTFHALVDESATDVIAWQGLGSDGLLYLKQAQLPRVIFVQ